MDINIALAALSVAASLAYGLVLVGRPPSMLRMVVKTASVAALAALAWRAQNSALLVGALALSALGDAFMADPKRFLPLGMASFLLAHVAYIALFYPQVQTDLAMSEPWRAVAIAATGIVATGLFAWLWPGLGKLKPAAAAYVLAIGTMVIEALMLPPQFRLATLGALLFMASDAILAGQLFREARVAGSERLTQWAVWFLYWGAQVLILWGFTPWTTAVPAM